MLFRRQTLSIFFTLNSRHDLFKGGVPLSESEIFLSLFSPGNARFKFEHFQLFRQHCKQRLQFLGLFHTDMYRYREIPAEQVSNNFLQLLSFLELSIGQRIMAIILKKFKSRQWLVYVPEWST